MKYDSAISYSYLVGKGEMVAGKDSFYIWVWEREKVYDLNLEG